MTTISRMPPVPDEAPRVPVPDPGTPARGPAPGRVARRLRRWEGTIGMRREGRSLWLWTVPLVTAVVTFVLVLIAHPGDIDMIARLPVAIIGSLFMGAMSLSYLLAVGEDQE